MVAAQYRQPRTVPGLDRGPLLHAVQRLLEARRVEPHHHLLTDDDDWHTAASRDGGHVLQGLPILGDIVVRKGDAALRKKLFRHVAVGSGGGRVDRHLFHVLSPYLSSGAIHWLYTRSVSWAGCDSLGPALGRARRISRKDPSALDRRESPRKFPGLLLYTLSYHSPG